MSYNEDLEFRIREVLSGLPDLEGKKMFGGIGFLVKGNMACGVHKDALIIRVGPDAYNKALARPHTRPFDITGRPMTGWVMVEWEGYKSDEELKKWVKQGVDYALTLTPK
ncbi:MAG: TfoX/Sxy family protein [Dehalococcoidia bacterium]|nr:MAG: TfoX/Sxy family protein [Dehalococcoidia bacterium]